MQDPASELPRIHLPRTPLNKGSEVRGWCGVGCLRPAEVLCYTLLGKEGRGLEARPARGLLLGRVEPVAQPATPTIKGVACVARVLWTFLPAFGRPLRHGCRIEPVRGGGRAQGIGTEEQKGLPEVDYQLDESDPDVAVLRRQEGTFVAAFSASGATREGILEAAEEDYQKLLEAHSSGSLGHREDASRKRSA
jgi:hypothetical protein